MEDNMWRYGIVFVVLPVFLTIIEFVRSAYDKSDLLEEQLKQNMNALRKGTEIMAKEITDAITEKNKPVSISSYTLPRPDYCTVSSISANFDELHSILEAVRATPQRIVYRTNCPNCGAPLNEHGKCEYCTTITDRKPVVKEKKPDTLICDHGIDGFDELKLYADDKVIARTVIDRLNGKVVKTERM